jgi:hypothetical protein
MLWVLFHVPCPTPDGRTARDLYEKRVRMIDAEMQAGAKRHGCHFHRAWHAQDGSAFYAVALWESREGARAFFQEFEIEDEPGEQAIFLEGDVGLVPLPG